ncbi:MAG: dihydrolipoamide acetyltransferase family protein [Bernardetiaceae bacterium]
MARVEMVMPKMGESVMEGTILSWLKSVGDAIEADESVLEVATDKVDTEVPATDAGTLVEILAQEGDVVPVGSPIAIIETAADAVDAPPVPAQIAAVPQPTPTPTAPQPAPTAPQPVAAGRFYSPLVLNIAKQENLPMEELERIPGTGLEGRLTKNDLFAYLNTRKATPAPTPAPTPVAKPAPPTPAKVPAATSISGNVEIIEMDRMRKMIAQRMVESVHTSPHVTSFVEADLTRIVDWRNAHKKDFKARTGQNLTFTPIFVEAVARALRDFPMLNSSIDGDRIIVKKDINVGIAVALPSGNLIVPVVHHADRLNLGGLALQINELVEKARRNKLSPDDLSGGTYTLSNIGTFGNLLGTPILVQPQVGILSTGAIVKKPAVLTLPDGQDVIAIRQMMFLSHSYDHRIVDGALGGQFVRRVADYLEQFDTDQRP